MSLAIRFQAEPIRSLAFGSISGTYMGIGAALSNPGRQFIISNFTDVELFFSFDGVDDHIVLAANTSFVNDISSNQTFNQGWFLAEGTRIYVKDTGSAASSGNVYISIFYGKI